MLLSGQFQWTGIGTGRNGGFRGEKFTGSLFADSSIIIAMYYNDHVPPHFHARYGDFEAIIAIDTGEVVEGRLPPRVLGLVQEWREYHRTELIEDWTLARERKALKRIKPLE